MADPKPESPPTDPRESILLFYWTGISFILVAADYYSGPFIQFPVAYLIPVALASWYNGKWWGIGFAVVLSLVRFLFNAYAWTIPWTMLDATVNTIIRLLVFSAFAFILDRLATQTKVLSREVRSLEGLLPICSHCKKIRDQNNQWQVLEEYIVARSEASFTHGICPECLQKHYGDVLGAKL